MATPNTPNPAVSAVLTADLPGLPDARRSEVVSFVGRRFNTLPHHMRLGVAVLDRAMNLIVRIAGPGRFARFAHTRLPLVAEYFRLVRSLAYAYVWETWPDTSHDGSPR